MAVCATHPRSAPISTRRPRNRCTRRPARLLAALDSGWADPARLHHEGRTARLLWDNAREVVADALGARPDEVFFTPSGTAAVHTGVTAIAAAGRRAGSCGAATAVGRPEASVLSTALQAACGSWFSLPAMVIGEEIRQWLSISMPADRYSVYSAFVASSRRSRRPMQGMSPKWLEWKSTLDLFSKEDMAKLARQIVGMANRDPSAGGTDDRGFRLHRGGSRLHRRHRHNATCNVLRPILGSTGPAWDLNYLSVNGRDVLVVLVEAPRVGDPIHTIQTISPSRTRLIATLRRCTLRSLLSATWR